MLTVELFCDSLNPRQLFLRCFLLLDFLVDFNLTPVSRIETEMKEIVKEMGFNLTLPEFIEKLR